MKKLTQWARDYRQGYADGYVARYTYTIQSAKELGVSEPATEFEP